MKNKLVKCLFFIGTISASLYSQEIKFQLNDDVFCITQNSKVIFKDDRNLKSGICSNIEVLKSDFKNQFYLYIDNTCTLKKIKKKFEIAWINNKFSILNKEVIEIENNKISCKNVYFDNFIIDSLSIHKLDEEENGLFENFNKKNNKIPVFYKNKLIGNKIISTEDIKFNYPIIEKYRNVKRNITLYNDIAFILYNNHSFEESIYILKKVIEISPNRVVAYINIADNYWEINDREKAIHNYQKYYQLMKTQKKDLKKIPKYVHDRIKQYKPN